MPNKHEVEAPSTARGGPVAAGGSASPLGSAKLLIITCVIGLLACQVWLFHGMLPVALEGRVDFGVFYRIAGIFDAGQAHKIYLPRVQQEPDAHTATKVISIGRPFPHPPFEILLFAPLARLSYRSAYLVWTAVALASLVAGALALRMNPFVALAFYPVAVSLAQGQDSLLLFGILAFAYREFRRGRDGAAGVLLGLGLIKFQFTLPLVAILAVRGRWRLVAYFALSSTVLGVVSFLVVGPQGAVQYFRFLVSPQATPGVDVIPNLYGLIRYFGGGLLPTALLSAVVAAWGGLRRVPTRGREYALAVAASVLVSYHAFIMDYPLLLIPMQEQFESGRWESIAFFATPLYLLLFQLKLWPFLSLGLAAFLWTMTRSPAKGAPATEPATV